MDPTVAAQRLITLGAFGFMGMYGFKNCIFQVEPGHRAIMFNRLSGLNDKTTYSEGWHFRVPWFQRPIIYNIRTKANTYTSLTGSKDLQMVNISVRILTRPMDSALAGIYRRIGLQYDKLVYPSLVEETLKSIVAQYNASQLLTQRDMVSAMVRANLNEKLSGFNIILDDVSITDLGFGREFEGAIEAKQVAQQEAERAKFVVDRAMQEKKGIIIKAQAEARATELVGTAIQKNPAYLQLKRIDTARNIADIIMQSKNRVLIDSDTLLLNLGKQNVYDLSGNKQQ